MSRSRCRVTLFSLLVACAGCTSVEAVRLPEGRGRGTVFVTQQDHDGPYQSLGPVQVTRRGSTLVGGFVDPAGLTLEEALEDLQVQARSAGADGVINVRYQRVLHSVPTRVLFTLLFFIPLPGEVTITGELIRLRPVSASSSARVAP